MIFMKGQKIMNEQKMVNSDAGGLGQNIAEMRKKKGLTQSALAEMLFVSNKTVSKWERGAGYPEIQQLVRLSELLGCSVDRLLRNKHSGIAIAGNILTDYVKIIDFQPEKGMLCNILSVSRAVGGCVPNTGIDLAKIDSSLQLSALGLVGDDEAGQYVLSELQKNNLDTSRVKISKNASTGFSDVMTLKSTGERTFYHHRGGNAMFAPEDVDVDTLDCKMLHIGYILLLDRFDAKDAKYGTAMARFLKKVQEKGIKTSLDLVSSSDRKLFAEKVLPALKYTDNAMMNEIECCAVTGLEPRDGSGKLITENIKKSMKSLLDEGVSERVIVHCPEAGFIYNKNGEFTCVPSVKHPKGYIKGTVGAGDAFSAGCLYGIYNGFSDHDILEFASGAATCNLAAEDSVSGMRSKEYIYELLEKSEKVKFSL